MTVPRTENLSTTNLAVPLTIGQTTVTVDDASRAPAAPGIMMVFNSTLYPNGPPVVGTPDGNGVEFITYDSPPSGNVFSGVARAADGTTEKNHSAAGDVYKVVFGVFRYHYDLIGQNIGSGHNIRHYGAHPSKTAAENATAIGLAIAAAQAAGGGTVHVPAGDYTTDSNTIDGDDVKVFGEAGAILRQAAAGATVFTVEDCDGAQFCGLQFVGVGDGGSQPFTSTSDDSAIRFRSTAGTPAIGDLNRVRVANCHFSGFRFNAVWAEFVRDIRFESLTSDGNHSGFAYWACADGEMRGCHCVDGMIDAGTAMLGGGFGVHMDSAEAINSENIRLIDCHCRGLREMQSFLAHSGDGLTFIGCTADDCQTGIDVFPAAAQTSSWCRDVVIDGCTIDLAKTTAVQVHETVTGTPTAGNKGMTLGGNGSGNPLTRCTVSNCIIRGANHLSSDASGAVDGWGGILVASETVALKIIGCDISDCQANGVQFAGDNNADFIIASCRFNDISAGDGDPGSCIHLETTTGSMTGSGGLVTGCHFDDSPEGIRVHANDSPATALRIDSSNHFGAGLTTRIANVPNEDANVWGSLDIDSGAWNGGHLVMGAYHLWMDTSGRLRVKSGAPTSETDGAVVGGQS